MPQGIIVSLEGLIVLYCIVSGIDQCIPEDPGAMLGHPCVAGIEVSGLVYRRIQSGECKQGLEKR